MDDTKWGRTDGMGWRGLSHWALNRGSRLGTNRFSVQRWGEGLNRDVNPLHVMRFERPVMV